MIMQRAIEQSLVVPKSPYSLHLQIVTDLLLIEKGELHTAQS
jgi:hypothetical protein